MQKKNAHELLDFGNGRKLERFGKFVLDRPAAAATASRHQKPALWNAVHARFEIAPTAKTGSSRGAWQTVGDMPSTWPIRFGRLHFELKLTDFGHVGVFPEQAANWTWIQQHLKSNISTPPRVLNLFAYTGGSTMAVAAGAAVTHVDAAKNAVAWARRNAARSGLTDAPIRWIADDALKFAQRELKRGRRYDAIVLDPPTYGHGPSGEIWRLAEHLPRLLEVCRELIEPQPRFVLLTCHAADYDPPRLAECLVDAGLASPTGDVEAGDLWLTTADGRRLHSGAFARIALSP